MQGSYQPPSSFNERHYDELVNEAVAYIKGGQRDRARRLLERATLLGVSDARAWLWLSATTDDLQEQRSYLEHAVGADPSNAAARRGLVMLSEKMKSEKVLAEGEEPQPRQSTAPEDAQSQAYTCPKCGGRLQYDPQVQGLSCVHCGTVQSKEQITGVEHLEQAADFVIPTERGHRWAEGQRKTTCEQCGALSLLPPGQTSDRCPYCGSNRLVTAGEQADLLDPQAIGLVKIVEKEALKRVKEWLGKGWSAPDDLKDRSEHLQLRPAYYPFWTFDGTIELPWTCEVNVGSSRSPHWVSRNGLELKFFDEILTTGLRKISMPQLSAIEPFDLKGLVPFSAEYLAGWSALSYDISMADASLLGREKVIQRLRRELYATVEPGKEKRNLNSGAGKWSGMTFKYIFLPLWVGAYHFQGKEFPILVNGQTGKVGGSKPRDDIKVAMIVAAGVLTLLAVLAIFYMILTRGGLPR